MRRNVLWVLAGNLSYAFSLWATLALLTKLTSPEVVGKFNLGFAITAPVFFLFSLSLRSIQATDARQEYGFATYFLLRLASVGAAVAVSVAVAALGDHPLDTRLVIVCVAMAKAAGFLSDIVYGMFQRQERMREIAESLIVRGAMTIVVVSVVMRATANIVAATLAMTLAWATVFACLDLWRAHRERALNFRGAAEPIPRMFRTALPLGFVMMLISLNANIPIYVLNGMLDEAAVGIFSVVNYVGIAGNTVVGALANVVAPRLAQLHARGEREEFQKLLDRLVIGGLALGALGVVGALVLGRLFLSILYQPEYGQHAPMLAVLMAGYGFGYSASFVGVSLTAKRDLRVMVPINVATVIVTTAGCAFGVSRMGLIGAAWGLTIALTFKFLLNYGVARLR